MNGNFEYIISKLIKKLHLRAIKDSEIHKSSSIGAGSVIVNSHMDKHSFCGYDCTIVNTNIGSFCSIAGDCEIGGASHSIDWVSTSPVFNKNKDQIKKKYSYHKFDYKKTTYIGNDVWIGAKCLVKAGVKIGDGAVIGMGSVVTKDVPAYEVWAGNPAKLIRKRFEDSKISKLKEIQWWDFSDQKLEELSKYFIDLEEFIEKENERK
ncbi:CatB-related O-acetyltransferase [Planococcus glaciei]|uniref:CatB-related O-acetyltransferase n=1 Tax=Planococcus glaciei TaxID=459472 RepID=UPI000941F873|nr:CatB-related O-acetyltransferase [Planococcus glaciei]